MAQPAPRPPASPDIQGICADDIGRGGAKALPLIDTNLAGRTGDDPPRRQSIEAGALDADVDPVGIDLPAPSRKRVRPSHAGDVLETRIGGQLSFYMLHDLFTRLARGTAHHEEDGRE